MANKGAVTIKFLIEDSKDGLKKLVLDADSLRKVMSENVKIADKFQDDIVKNSCACSNCVKLAR